MERVCSIYNRAGVAGPLSRLQDALSCSSYSICCSRLSRIPGYAKDGHKESEKAKDGQGRNPWEGVQDLQLRMM